MVDLFKFIYMTGFKAFVYCLLGLISFVIGFEIYKSWEMQKMSVYPIVDDGFCKVAVIPVAGVIGFSSSSSGDVGNGITSSMISPYGDVDRIIGDLEYLKKMNAIEGIVLQIDSPGGSLGASETLYNYLKNYTAKPVVAVFRESGTSGAYMAALGTQRIFSSRGAMVGSIGVTSSHLNISKKNEKDGVEFVSLSSGKYKDILSPDKKFSLEEYKIEKENILKLGEIFKYYVATERKLPEEVVNELADGRVWNGDDAFKLGLIDQIGGVKEATEYLAGKLGYENLLDVTACPVVKY